MLHELITRYAQTMIAELREADPEGGGLPRYVERDLPSTSGLHVAALARHASVDRIRALVRRASEAGVEVQDLSRFAIGGSPRPGLVLGYGAIPTARINEGLRQLKRRFDER